MLRTVVQRRAVRRAVQTHCQAVDVLEFQMIAEHVVDLSPRGMLVECGARTRVGNPIVVSFQVPGRDELWIDAEAVVVRLVEGPQWSRNGYGAGLEFTSMQKKSRDELVLRLAGLPPPVPKRARHVDIVSAPGSLISEPELPLVRQAVGAPMGAFTRMN